MLPITKRLLKYLLHIHNLNGNIWHFIEIGIYMCSYKLYLLWLWIYNEPDRADIIIFNEQHRLGINNHSDIRCPRKYCEFCRVNRIVMYLNNAKHTIDVAHMAFSNRIMLSAILDAWTRGIMVRIVTDGQMLNVRGSAISTLWNIGIPIRSPSEETVMHHKFALVDGEPRLLQLDADEKQLHSRLWSRRRGYVITGSLNWTKQGTCNNYENVVVTSNRTVQHVYQSIFDRLWSISYPLDKMGHPGFDKHPSRINAIDKQKKYRIDDDMNNVISAKHKLSN